MCRLAGDRFGPGHFETAKGLRVTHNEDAIVVDWQMGLDQATGHAHDALRNAAHKQRANTRAIAAIVVKGSSAILLGVEEKIAEFLRAAYVVRPCVPAAPCDLPYSADSAFLAEAAACQ